MTPAPLPPNPPADRKLPRIDEPTDVAGVVTAVDAIVAWAADVPSGIGYFAVMQKRIAISVEAAISRGDFENAELVRRLTLTFVGRYFAALNAYFHPEPFERPTKAWQWAFDGVSYDEPIVLQHLLTGISAHIGHDLGVATAQVGGRRMADLKADFDMVNGILASQVAPVMEAVAAISPVVEVILRHTADDAEAIVSKWIVKFRDLAWSFAENLVDKPPRLRELTDVQDAWTSVLSTYFVYPPSRPMRALLRLVANAESRDVAANIRRLDQDSLIPVGVNPAFLQALTF